jgi:hypothetical protein
MDMCLIESLVSSITPNIIPFFVYSQFLSCAANQLLINLVVAERACDGHVAKGQKARLYLIMNIISRILNWPLWRARIYVSWIIAGMLFLPGAT